MSAPSLRPEDSPNSPVICPTFEDIDSAQDSLVKEKEQLSIQIQSLESSLDDSRCVFFFVDTLLQVNFLRVIYFFMNRMIELIALFCVM